MTTHADVPFEITRWDATPYDAPDEGAKLSRVAVGKRYAGPLVGESTAELLVCQGPDDSGLAYTAVERVTGNLNGRAGSFVIQHGAVSGDDAPGAVGAIVPGSGTGNLRDLRGTVAFRHDERGAILTLEYDFA